LTWEAGQGWKGAEAEYRQDYARGGKPRIIHK
jgi:hypothetical protein